jgi:tetratricopeptide (TPR) repeat protein/peroxiredoxin
MQSIITLSFAVAIAACGLIPPAHATEARASLDPEVAVEELRTLFYARDYEGGYLTGHRLVEQYPDHPELRAWHILHLSRNDMGMKARQKADALLERYPESPWAQFAFAAANIAVNDRDNKGEEAIEAARRTMDLMPDNPDAMMLLAETLRQHGDREEAIRLIDSFLERGPDPNLLVVRAFVNTSTFLADRENRDEDLLEQVLADHAAARALDPDNVGATYLAGFAKFNYTDRFEEAFELLSRAAELSPDGTRIHEIYWQAVSRHPALSREEKRAIIEADIAAMLERRPDALKTMAVAARQYGQWGEEDARREMEERVLATAPDSPDAERILFDRVRAFGQAIDRDAEDAPARIAEYRQMLSDFASRPVHHTAWSKGDAYLMLFFELNRDPDTATDVLLRAVEGMVAHNSFNPHITHIQGPIALAERGFFRRAEEIAREGEAVMLARLEQQRQFFDTPEDFERAVEHSRAQGLDALGWVYYLEGRLDEAETSLLKAFELSPTNRTNLHRIGTLYADQGDLDRAEEFFVQGMEAPGFGENPNDRSLQEIYERRYGSLDGFEEYRAAIVERVRENRRLAILAARLEEPRPVDAFTLATLEGSTMGLEEIQGRIAVINFWGVWCGWCVKEMPDYQRLTDAFADDPDVLILTINNDADPDEVREWMAEHGYTFPVMLDDGFVSRAGVRAFPTTWFLDREGRVAFEQIGYTEGLVEEFTWRIEDLRSGGV